MKSYSRLILMFIVVILLISCSDKEGQEQQSESLSKSITLPEEFSYEGRNPEIGNPENLQLIMNWNERRSGLIHEIGDLVTDTVTMNMSEGTQIIIPRDSLVAYLKGFNEQISNQQITINAAIPIYYSDLDHEWVYSWVYMETEFKDGKKATSYFHEDYRITNGKISLMYQFKRNTATDR